MTTRKKEPQQVSIEQVGAEDIQVFENDIDLYLHRFCEENNINDLKKESQSVWNSCLRFVYKNVFKNGILKQRKCIDNPNSKISSTYNSYNYELVLDILDIYVYDMCMKFDKEVSILGFSTLTGIPEQLIYNWGNEQTKLSTRSFEIYKKLNQYREESLSNKLATGKQNPVGVIAMLNHHYGWASPYTSDSRRERKALSDSELPTLNGASDGGAEVKGLPPKKE